MLTFDRFIFGEKCWRRYFKPTHYLRVYSINCAAVGILGRTLQIWSRVNVRLDRNPRVRSSGIGFTALIVEEHDVSCHYSNARAALFLLWRFA